MNHIHFNIKDLRWAVTLAGAIVNARTGVNKEVNTYWSVSFERTSPAISHLADCFEAKPKDAIDYNLPLDEQCQILDHFAAANFANNLAEQHGIKQDLKVVPLYCNALAFNTLLMTHGIMSKAGYFYPDISNTEKGKLPHVDALIQHEDLRPRAEAFLAGLEVTNPVIKCIDTLDEWDVVKYALTCKFTLSYPNHYIQYITRAQYKGFDYLGSYNPVGSYIDPSIKNDDRYLTSWCGQVPILSTDSLQTIEDRGRLWKLQAKYNFDHRAIYKAYYEASNVPR